MKKIFLCLLTAVLPAWAWALPSATPTAGTGSAALQQKAREQYAESSLRAKVQGLYYDYRPLGLKTFRCRVNDEGAAFPLLFFMFGQREVGGKEVKKKPIDPAKAEEFLKFYLAYNGKNGFRVEHQDSFRTGDANTDRGLQEIVKGIKSDILSFADVWGAWSLASDLDGPKAKVTVTQTGSGYTVEETKGGQTAVFYFNPQGLLTDARMPFAPNGPGDADLKFDFQHTGQGYLMKAVSFKAVQGQEKGRLGIEYEELGDFQMPKWVRWTTQSVDKDGQEKNEGNYLSFYNYEINGEAYDSPEPEPPSIDFLWALQRVFNLMIHAGVEVHMGLGPLLSTSPQLAANYRAAPALDFGIGYEFTKSLSLSIEAQGADYANKNGATSLSMGDFFILGKYRLATGDFRPYLLGGVGISDSNFFTNSAPSDTDQNEVNLALEAGAGMEVKIGGDLFLFAQSDITDHLLTSNYAQGASVDSPITYVPLEFGLAFEM